MHWFRLHWKNGSTTAQLNVSAEKITEKEEIYAKVVAHRMVSAKLFHCYQLTFTKIRHKGMPEVVRESKLLHILRIVSHCRDLTINFVFVIGQMAGTG